MGDILLELIAQEVIDRSTLNAERAQREFQEGCSRLFLKIEEIIIETRLDLSDLGLIATCAKRLDNTEGDGKSFPWSCFPESELVASPYLSGNDIITELAKRAIAGRVFEMLLPENIILKAVEEERIRIEGGIVKEEIKRTNSGNEGDFKQTRVEFLRLVV